MWLQQLMRTEAKSAGYKLGVLGGSFNPIHYGHLHVARFVRKLFSLSEVRFVVAANPPHKRPEALIPLMHRYAMVSVATVGEPSFVPSLIELERPASSFSIDTMRKLARQVAKMNGTLYFIAGGDSLLEVKTWRDSEKLLASYNFIFVVRPGCGVLNPRQTLPVAVLSKVSDLVGLGMAEMRRRIREQSSEENKIYIVDAGAPNISATQVRRLVRMGKPINWAVPKAVREYIEKFHLYGEK